MAARLFGEPMKDTVLMRLRNWIAGSGLAKGDRLPPERELCTILGVSRAELRKALLVLESEGMVERNIGRGTFLARASRSPRGGGGIDRTISALSETTGPAEAMSARLVIEPQLARLAALHATPKQLRDMRRLADSMREATSWAVYEQLDSEFHEAIGARRRKRAVAGPAQDPQRGPAGGGLAQAEHLGPGAGAVVSLVRRT